MSLLAKRGVLVQHKHKHKQQRGPPLVASLHQQRPRGLRISRATDGDGASKGSAAAEPLQQQQKKQEDVGEFFWSTASKQRCSAFDALRAARCFAALLHCACAATHSLTLPTSPLPPRNNTPRKGLGLKATWVAAELLGDASAALSGGKQQAPSPSQQQQGQQQGQQGRVRSVEEIVELIRADYGALDCPLPPSPLLCRPAVALSRAG